MTGASILLYAAVVPAAVVLTFCAIGVSIRLLDRLADLAVDKAGWFVLLAVGLWLCWELAPGSHAVLMHLWAGLRGQAGTVAKHAKEVL